MTLKIWMMKMALGFETAHIYGM